MKWYAKCDIIIASPYYLANFPHINYLYAQKFAPHKSVNSVNFAMLQALQS